MVFPEQFLFLLTILKHAYAEATLLKSIYLDLTREFEYHTLLFKSEGIVNAVLSYPTLLVNSTCSFMSLSMGT